MSWEHKRHFDKDFISIFQNSGRGRMVAEACKVITVPVTLKLLLFVLGKLLLTCSLCQCVLLKPMELFHHISIRFVWQLNAY